MSDVNLAQNRDLHDVIFCNLLICNFVLRCLSEIIYRWKFPRSTFLGRPYDRIWFQAISSWQISQIDMLDMGTKVQFESYLPRYYPMRNLDEGISSNQSRYYEDEAFNGQLFVDSKPRPMSGYSEYDKEMLKRTMLEHEAIFRKQVYELHRLYRVQKDMMDEFKSKQFYKFCGPINALKTSMFPSQMTPEAGERTLHSSYPSVRNYYNAVNITDTNDKRTAINFLKEVSIQHIPTSTDNGGYIKNNRSLDSNPKTSRRTFDLHLPADVYIESDDSEITEKQNPEPRVSTAYKLDINADVAPESEVNLTLATVNFHSCRENNQRSNIQQKDEQPFCGLADLNEPCTDLLYEGVSFSGSCMPNNLKFHCQDVHENPTPTSNSISLQRDFLTVRSKEGTCSSDFSVDKEDHRQQWPLLHDSGKCRSISGVLDSGTHVEKYPMSSESIQLRLKKAHEGRLPDKRKSDIMFGYKASEFDEISGRNPNVLKLNYSRHSAEETINKPPYASSSMNPTSSLPNSFWKSSGKMNQVPVAVQELPSFIGHSNSQSSAIQRQNNGCEKMQFDGNMQPQSANGSQSYHANAFNHGFPLDSKSSSSLYLLPITIDKPNLNDGANSTYENTSSVPQKCLKSLQYMDIKCANNLDMNSEMTKKIPYGFTAQEELNGKHDGLNALHRLNKPTSNKSAYDKSYDPQRDANFTKGYPQQVSSSGKLTNGFVIGEKDEGISICALKNPISPFKLNECRNQRNGVSHNPNNREIISFSLFDKLQQSFSHTNSGQYQDQLLADNQKCTRKGKGVKSSNITIRKDINLNSSIIVPDDSYFPGVTVKDKELPSTASFSCNTGSLTCKIDLEAPVEVEHNNTTAIELVKMNHFEEPGHRDRFYLHETLRVAANTIVSLSMDAKNLDSDVSGALAPASCDSLRWFAEVVTSNSDITAYSRGKGGGDIHVSDDEGSDSFESLTLKLEELKEDEYLCRPYKHEIPQDDDKFTSSLLFTRSRRGQARKRRQRKDFQRDILPTIASLSKQEVAEDLYSLGGLPKASSKARNTGSGRRGTGRNGQTRGRKPRSLVVTVAEVHESSPPMQSTPTELETDERSIKGWGRTTRRCRRQRTQLIPASGLEE